MQYNAYIWEIMNCRIWSPALSTFIWEEMIPRALRSNKNIYSYWIELTLIWSSDYTTLLNPTMQFLFDRWDANNIICFLQELHLDASNLFSQVLYSENIYSYWIELTLIWSSDYTTLFNPTMQFLFDMRCEQYYLFHVGITSWYNKPIFTSSVFWKYLLMKSKYF